MAVLDASPNDVALPSISVIVPTYGRPSELARCLAALAAQDYPVERFEIVVVDDGGDPPASRAADPGRPGLRVAWLRQPNAGPSAARNAGVRAASGTILAFTDDDCTPDPGWLRAIARTLAADPGALLGGAVENGLPANGWSVASHTITEVAVPYHFAAGSALRFFTSNNLALDAAHFRAVGGFDERFRWAEDRELCHRWLVGGRTLKPAPAAVVRHLHDLAPRSFWRQHFGYGRGAYRLHRLRKERGLGPFRPDIVLALATFRRPFASLPASRAIAVAARLVVWQLANAAGFAWQWARDRRARHAA